MKQIIDLPIVWKTNRDLIQSTKWLLVKLKLKRVNILTGSIAATFLHVPTTYAFRSSIFVWATHTMCLSNVCSPNPVDSNHKIDWKRNCFPYSGQWNSHSLHCDQCCPLEIRIFEYFLLWIYWACLETIEHEFSIFFTEIFNQSV